MVIAIAHRLLVAAVRADSFDRLNHTLVLRLLNFTVRSSSALPLNAPPAASKKSGCSPDPGRLPSASAVPAAQRIADEPAPDVQVVFLAKMLNVHLTRPSPPAQVQCVPCGARPSTHFFGAPFAAHANRHKIDSGDQRDALVLAGRS